MAYLILPSRRTRQPQTIARVANRYSRLGSIVVNYATGNYNLVDGSRPNLVVGSGPTLSGQYGLKREHYTYTADEFTVSSTTEFTLLSLMDCSISSYAGVFCSLIGGDDTSNRQFQFRHTNTAATEFIRFSTAVDVSTVTAPINLLRSGCHIAVSSGNSHKCRNELGWSNTGTILNTPKPITKFSIGGKYNFDSALVGSKTTYLAAFFPWALPDAEIDELIRNPWQLFAGEPRRIYFGAGGGTTDVSAALTGSAVTSNAGTAVANVAQALSGSAVTTSAGTVTPVVGVTVALSGSAVTATAGTLSVAISNALSGSAVTTSAGTVTPSTGTFVALSGAAVTTSVGTLSVAVSCALSGSAVTASAGTVTNPGQSIWTDVGVSAATWADVGAASSIWTDL